LAAEAKLRCEVWQFYSRFWKSPALVALKFLSCWRSIGFISLNITEYIVTICYLWFPLTYSKCPSGNIFIDGDIVLDTTITRSTLIHRTAIIAPDATIGNNTTIGPYSVIGAGVRIGNENRIGPHVVIEGRTIIGDSNQIYQFASVGAPPQDLKYEGEESLLMIGDRNIIREYATLQPGTAGGGGRTIVGSDNLFMACSHVAHDCVVANHVRLANAATLAGHIEVGEGAILSGLCAVHQFVRIGKQAFVSGGAMVTQDVPPFCTAQGDRAHLVGLNSVGLQRAGMTENEILNLRRAFKLLFHSDGILAQRISQVTERFSEFQCVRDLLDFVASSTRGIVSARRSIKAT
jgi:UDP-N-acetylglucosamine acyltransferase